MGTRMIACSGEEMQDRVVDMVRRLRVERITIERGERWPWEPSCIVTAEGPSIPHRDGISRVLVHQSVEQNEQLEVTSITVRWEWDDR